MPRQLSNRQRFKNAGSAVLSMAGSYMAKKAISSGYNNISKALTSNKQKAYVKKKVKKFRAKQIKARNPAIQQLDRKINRLARDVNLDTSVFTYRRNDFGSLLTTASIKSSVEVVFNSAASLETAMAGIRYWDSTSGAYEVANPATDAKSKSINVVKCFSKMEFKNNYQVPCVLTVYSCKSKFDTSIGPVTAFTNWATDNLVSGSNTHPQLYLSDSTHFNELWKIVQKKESTLYPGQSMTISDSLPPFMYDSGAYDSHALAYQKSFHGMAYAIQVTGVVAHDSASATELGLCPAGIDYVQTRTWSMKYDSGGPSVKLVHVVNSGDTAFTNGAVVSQQTVDNQSYSVA